MVVNLLLLAAAGDDPDDIEGLAKSVGVLKARARLRFIATCAGGCGTPRAGRPGHVPGLRPALTHRTTLARSLVRRGRIPP
jgi:hypothetical protein